MLFFLLPLSALLLTLFTSISSLLRLSADSFGFCPLPSPLSPHSYTYSSFASCAGFPRLSPLFSLTLISFYHQCFSNPISFLCSSPYYCYYYHLTMQNFFFTYTLQPYHHHAVSPFSILFLFPSFFLSITSCIICDFFFHFSFLPLPQLVSSHCPPSLFRFLISLLPHPLFSPILLSAHSCFLLLTQSTSSSLTFSTAAHPVFLPLLLPTIVLLLYTSSVSCLMPPPFSSLICFSTPPHSLFCFYF